MLVKAMEVSGIEGNFRFTCESVMQVLRTNKDSVMAMMEVQTESVVICNLLLHDVLDKFIPLLMECWDNVKLILSGRHGLIIVILIRFFFVENS